MLATVEIFGLTVARGSCVSARILTSGMHLSLYGAAVVGPKRLSSATYRAASQYIIFESVILLLRGVDRLESLKCITSILAASFALYKGNFAQS